MGRAGALGFNTIRPPASHHLLHPPPLLQAEKLGFHVGNVSACANGDRLSTGGYEFKLVGGPDPRVSSKAANPKPGSKSPARASITLLVLTTTTPPPPPQPPTERSNEAAKVPVLVRKKGAKSKKWIKYKSQSDAGALEFNPI